MRRNSFRPSNPVAALARHHQVVGRATDLVQGLPPVVDILNAAVRALQEVREEAVNVGVRVYQQQAARRTHSISTLRSFQPSAISYQPYQRGRSPTPER